MIQTILMGIASGVSRALVGYVKNLPDAGVDNAIDWAKAAPALITGAVIGVYSAYAGINLATAEAFIASTGATYIVGEAYNFVMNYIKSKKLIATKK